jgi:succinoglycan biosynthesis protein ExoA
LSITPDPARIVVAVPTLNEERHIETVLRALIEQDPRMASVRIVVADGGSTDGTCEIVRGLMKNFPRLQLVHNPKRLQAAAVNLVARSMAGEADILVRCDAHAVYPPTYVMDAAESLMRHDVDSVVAPMDAVGETCFGRANAWVVDTPFGSGGSAHRGGTASGFVDHGHHCAFRLARFLSLGGYDETFSHNEDAEYDRRLAAAGGRIWLDASVRMGVFARPTLDGLWRQYLNYGRGRARTLRKHGGAPRLRQMIPPANLALVIGAIALAPVAPVLLVWPALYICGLLGVSALAVLKMRSLCGIWAGLAAGTMHTAWSLGFFQQMLKGAPPRAARAGT